MYVRISLLLNLDRKLNLRLTVASSRYIAGSMKMNKWTVVACVVVATLGLLTVILGIAGTASAAQSFVGNKYGVCEYESSPAVVLGIMAALLALTTQIVATAATGCCGCCRKWGIPSEPKRIVAIVLASLSWVLSITVVILFMVGAFVATGSDQLPTRGKCDVPPGTGEFAAATILFIVAVVFQIASYILLEATTLEGSKKPVAEESGIPMGRPVEPQPDNADQKVAAGGDPPRTAPAAASSETSADAPPSAKI